MQTSYEVFNHFIVHKNQDSRTILVRVILPTDEQTRRKIIKATNNQTEVNPLSLHATEDIHFDIEELFKLYDIFYDRRKGEHRRLRRPISKIISIKDLAQDIIAIVLRRPDTARARPMTILGSKDGYIDIFDTSANRELFLTCALLDRQVYGYLSSCDDLSKDVRNDIRYYMDTWIASILSNKSNPTKSDIAALAPHVKNALPPNVFAECRAEIMGIYTSHGANDTAAKSSDMRESVIKAIKLKFDGR